MGSRTLVVAIAVTGHTCCGRGRHEFEVMLLRLGNWTAECDIWVGMVDANVR